MPRYDYEIIETGEVIEVEHSIKQDALTEMFSPERGKPLPCKRLISFSAHTPGFVLKGDGWTVKSSGFGQRGYKGKYQSMIRDAGTPVDAPAAKHEADHQFQHWVDSGGLRGIKPSMDFDAKAKPMTGAERVGKANSEKS